MRPTTVRSRTRPARARLQDQAKSRIRLVWYSHVAGPMVIHGLQGGGAGLGGKFIEATWCGIENGKPAWEHLTPCWDALISCSACVRARRAAARSWRR